jgi:hypothetical protein
MLVIRQEQMMVFEEAARRSFENEMVAHLQQFAPRQSELMGEPSVKMVVKPGMERADGYGLDHQGPVRSYLELMFMLGTDFDTDPQYPWLAEILNDQKIMSQEERADRLYKKTMDYVEKDALDRVTHKRFKDLPNSEATITPDVIGELTEVHPEKCDYIGEPALRALIQRADEAAREYAIISCAGVAVVTGLMFAFGHGCCTDPQFPWIAKILGDSTLVDPDKKVERLYEKMIAYFDHVLALMEKK